MGNIVWLASYPKSGNTWLRAFIYNLIEDPPRPGAIADLPSYFEDESKPRWYQPHAGEGGFESLSFDDAMALRPQVHQDIADSRLRGSVFTKTHNMFGQFGGASLHNIAVMAGAIYVVRNPLDVVLSVADHFGLGIDEAIDFMASEETGTPTNPENVAGYMGSWSTHVASWTVQPHPSIVVVRYEDMQDKPAKAFGSIARLLGMDRDRKRVRKAIQYSSFRVLKKQEREGGFVEKSPNSKAFFRKGVKNQWVEQLSDEQVARIVDRHREQMLRFNYVPPRFR
ncbi:sulfotransferase domain-containing protein [Elongatibacter sediminis]|uniref:Sulfotransferase domain-containing protein n=1 Tax=Elongatibacter sediminis TaxID=3119006 RepID=A0AAW9RJF7_9GAMM